MTRQELLREYGSYVKRVCTERQAELKRNPLFQAGDKPIRSGMIRKATAALNYELSIAAHNALYDYRERYPELQDELTLSAQAEVNTCFSDLLKNA